jgi:ferredoxin-NADP reductase
LPSRWPATGDAAATARPVRELAPNAVLIARHDLTGDLARFTIQPDGGVPPFHAGQYVSVGLPGDAGPVLRPYSIASGPRDLDRLELLIRRLDGGALTSRLWDAPAGTRLFMGPPRGLFTLTRDDATAAAEVGAPMLFLSAGTGLAPVMSMLETLAGSSSRPRAVLLHGVARANELAYQDRLTGWARQGWLSHRPTVSRPDAGGADAWTGATGRVESHIERVLDEERIDPAAVRVYACGNDGMVAASREALAIAGVPSTAIRFESFTPAKSRAA